MSVEHYIVIRCICGFWPDDNLTDQEAFLAVRAHIRAHNVRTCEMCKTDFIVKRGRKDPRHCSRKCQESAVYQRNKKKRQLARMGARR